jgi:hypothetical protein
MNHKAKVKLARSMLTGVEKKLHTPIFLSAGWTKRQEAIKKRVAKRGKKKIIKK